MLKREIQFQLAIIHRLVWAVHEEFLHVVFDQQRTSKDAHNLKDGTTQFEVMFNDGNEAVCDDSDMDLYAYGIFGLTPKSFGIIPFSLVV